MLFHIILLVTPLTEALHGQLDVTAPPQRADVIVCLGGRDERVVAAARAYHAGFAPKVLVSNNPEAVREMHDLLRVYDVPEADILIDDKSYVTADHPAGVAAVPGIDPAGSQLLIVTDDYHSLRARGCFRHGGYAHFTISSPRYFSGREPAERGVRWRVFMLPYMAYEYTALLKYRLEGRL